MSLTETDFYERAGTFLRELGQIPEVPEPDQDLIGTGVIDSLLLVSFLTFIENERGTELPDFPDLASGLSLRSAYALFRS